MTKKDIINKKKGEIIHEAKIDNEFKKENNFKIILVILLLGVTIFSMLFL